ncbi:hypothetical protein RFI_25201, partial [Reticulomyxa filosa]
PFFFVFMGLVYIKFFLLLLTMERNKLDERRKSLQLFLNSRSSKADLMKKGLLEKKDMAPQLRSVVDTLQQRLSMRQDHSILQATITESENCAQLNEQNEDSIAIKRHYEPVPSHIFLNGFVNKAVLDQIAKGYFTTHNHRLTDFDDGTSVNNNDVNQLSMILQVQDCTRNHNNGITHDYIVGDRVELIKVFFFYFILNIRTYYVYIMYINTCLCYIVIHFFFFFSFYLLDCMSIFNSLKKAIC